MAQDAVAPRTQGLSNAGRFRGAVMAIRRICDLLPKTPALGPVDYTPTLVAYVAATVVVALVAVAHLWSRSVSDVESCRSVSSCSRSTRDRRRRHDLPDVGLRGPAPRTTGSPGSPTRLRSSRSLGHVRSRGRGGRRDRRAVRRCDAEPERLVSNDLQRRERVPGQRRGVGGFRRGSMDRLWTAPARALLAAELLRGLRRISSSTPDSSPGHSPFGSGVCRSQRADALARFRSCRTASDTGLLPSRS